MSSPAVAKYLSKLQPVRIIRRLATNDDASAILSLVARCRAELGLTVTAEDGDLSDLQAHYELQGGAFFVLEKDGEIVATAGIARKSVSTASLTKFYVDPTIRGRKLGKQFLEATLGEAVNLGFAHIELETHRSMTRAQRLYESLGFRVKSNSATHSMADTTLTKKLISD